MRDILEAASSCRVLLSLHRIQELHVCQLLEWGKREAELGGHRLCRTPVDGHEGHRICIGCREESMVLKSRSDI